MNNYSFVQIKPNGSFLTIIDAKNTPRYMCFSNKMDAFHCISYVSKFRADHGSFPIIDLSRPGEKFEIKAKSLGTKRTPSSIAKYFKVTSYDENDIDAICAMNNINILYVTNFSYVSRPNQDIQIILSAQELNSNPNLYKYKKKLNDIFYK